MLKQVKQITEDFLLLSSKKPIRIISHVDTDGITSASILIKALSRMDKKFTLRVVKVLDEKTIKEELSRQPKEIIIFTDLASGSLDYFQNLKESIFIFDHHEVDSKKLNNKIKIINPHLSNNFEENDCTSAGISYLFSKTISIRNQDLANLAVIGFVGDRQEIGASKISKIILSDAQDLTIKKGLLVFPATRPLRRALEFSVYPYIPGVTGDMSGVMDLLNETKITPEKSILELNEEEMSRLITSIIMRRGRNSLAEEIIGTLYILKFLNNMEDVREISVLINACSRLGYSDIALSYCLGSEKAKMQALDIYNEYRQEIVSGLKVAEKMNKIDGKGFVILNARDQIKEAIVGTICSMLSSSPAYEEGTILIGMAYNKDKIKVSARIVGKNGKNLKEVLEKAVIAFRSENPGTLVEIGGHKYAAGCLIEKKKEKEFIDTLKKNLEIEVIKI
jgi:RecJ-like exonuclease